MPPGCYFPLISGLKWCIVKLRKRYRKTKYDIQEEIMV